MNVKALEVKRTGKEGVNEGQVVGAGIYSSIQVASTFDPWIHFFKKPMRSFPLHVEKLKLVRFMCPVWPNH